MKMKPLSFAARVLLYICLAAIVLAVLTHPDILQPLALLATLCLFPGTLVRPPVRTRDEACILPRFPALAPFSPRPPPVR